MTLRKIPSGLVCVWLAASLLSACGGGGGSATAAAGGGARTETYDIDSKGIPKFVDANYLDLANIVRISTFRSSQGHGYSDDFESCRSMKHYFLPAGGSPGTVHTPSWTTLSVYSPVDGMIVDILDESPLGRQIQIKSSAYPAFHFIIFHVTTSLNIGATVTKGQLMGTHASDNTMSDIAVRVNTPRGSKLVSFFDVMTDTRFADFQARGIGTRSKLIITKEARDADPLTCSGETFTTTGSLPGELILS